MKKAGRLKSGKIGTFSFDLFRLTPQATSGVNLASLRTLFFEHFLLWSFNLAHPVFLFHFLLSN